MLDEILDYTKIKLDQSNDKLDCKKSEFNITKSFDNSILYRVYKYLPIKDIDILIGMSDRTTEIKERYIDAKPINDFIKENPLEFKNLANMTKLENIKNIEKMQEELRKNIPYFIKYEKNYLWQIYYSQENNKYFMLFPAREEGEAEALFYLIKKKLEDKDEKIYVPICKEEPGEDFLKKEERTDLENYIWLFTKEWPSIYEVEVDTKKALYIVGKIRTKEGLESKYRIKIDSKKRAEEEYTLFKALFILSTEGKYALNPTIDDDGNLRLEYNEETINIDNLSKFISKEAVYQKEENKNLQEKINTYKEKQEKVRKQIQELNNIYHEQEKQIVMFLDCKKSVFKRIRFYFKKKVNFSGKFTEKEEKSWNDIKISNNQSESIEIKSTSTLSELVRLCKENSKVKEDFNNTKADYEALKNKKENLKKKIENAKKYLEEIESHKKSLFEFWKYAKKDEKKELMQAEENKNENKLEVKFNIDEDLPEFTAKADIMQKQNLAEDEINSIFACKYILNSINSVMQGKNEKEVLLNDLKILKDKYEENKKAQIFGDIEDDYTKVKNLNNKKHRENKRNIYVTLNINENTSYEEYKDRIESILKNLNNAYKKITSVADFDIYYTEDNSEGYTIAEIDSKKIDIKNLKNNTIFKIHINKDDNILYFSNIVYYDNLNKTLPNGMDVSLDVLVKQKEYKNKKETFINVLEEDGLYNVKINKIKVVDLYD